MDKLVVTEGQKVSATCRAEEEMGVLTFYFQDGLDPVYIDQGDRGHVQTLLAFHSGRTAVLTCYYHISLNTGQIKSNVSNAVRVVVQGKNADHSVMV